MLLFMYFSIFKEFYLFYNSYNAAAVIIIMTNNNPYYNSVCVGSIPSSNHPHVMLTTISSFLMLNLTDLKKFLIPTTLNV